MIYIKLEENMDKFMAKYKNLPRSMMKIIFSSMCKNGKFRIEKIDDLECIVLPTINDKIFKKLHGFSNIRCLKNVCLSENLKNDTRLRDFAKENNWNIIDGKWLFKYMSDEIFEYCVNIKNEMFSNQEITILCNKLDSVVVEKISEISKRVRVCNILTNNMKQYRKLEEKIYQTNGIILNVSNNYKKTAIKSSTVINFDFLEHDFDKCIFNKNAYIINMISDRKDKLISGRNIVDYEIDMPDKYRKYQRSMIEFNSNILYESFIYKNTSYMNIKKELEADDAKVLYLIDYSGKILKKHNLNFPKTLDKIVI